MTRAGINRAAAFAPLACSALAFAIVMTNVVMGVRPQPDETASAHLWQLLMAAQLPLIAIFAATSDWRSRGPTVMIAFQLVAIIIACLPVYLAGY